MLFADATVAEIAVIAGTIITPAGLLLTALWLQLNKNSQRELEAKDKSCERELKLLSSNRDAWKEMHEEAATALEDKVNADLVAQGKPPLIPIAPVIPEHSSPTSKDQQEAADLQTARARLVAAKLALGLPARRASEPEAGQTR